MRGWFRRSGWGERKVSTSSGQDWEGVSEEEGTGKRAAVFRAGLETQVIWGGVLERVSERPGPMRV